MRKLNRLCLLLVFLIPVQGFSPVVRSEYTDKELKLVVLKTDKLIKACSDLGEK